MARVTRQQSKEGLGMSNEVPGDLGVVRTVPVRTLDGGGCQRSYRQGEREGCPAFLATTDLYPGLPWSSSSARATPAGSQS